MRFEWDPEKAGANLAKHGLSFEQASRLFTGGADYLEIYDARHSVDEDRFIAVGPVRQGMIVVVYTPTSDDTLRIISARKATRREIEMYKQHMGHAS